MTDGRLFWLEITAAFRKSYRSAGGALSNFWVIVTILAAAFLLLWISPLVVTQELTLVFLYGIAVFELLLGMRTGFLRIGLRNDEYMLPVSARYWRRALPYLLPAILLPLPFVIAAASHLATSTATWWIIAISLLANALMFFMAGAGWGIIIRRISRRVSTRIFLLLLTLIAVFSTLSSGHFLFNVLFTYQSFGYYWQLLVILAEVSTIVFLAVLIELALQTIPITAKTFGQYYQILLASHPSGYGQGSSAFFSANRFMLRSSVIHRRLAAVLLGMMAATSVVYVSLFFAGAELHYVTVLIIAGVFSAASAQVISRANADTVANKIERWSYLPIDGARVTAGNWLSTLFWQLVMGVIFWGVAYTWFGAPLQTLPLVMIAAASQHIILYGWSQKLLKAAHHATASLSVFGLAVVIGVLPIALARYATLGQVFLIQLIWLAFIGILLQITSSRKLEGRYA